MKQKSIHQWAHRIFSIVLLVSILFSNTGGNSVSAANAQSDTKIRPAPIDFNPKSRTSTLSSQDICMLTGTVQITEDESNAIKSALSAAYSEVKFNGSECFAVIDVRDEGAWHLLTLVGVSGVQAGSEWTISSHGVWSDLALIHFSNTSINAAIAGTRKFSELLAWVPEVIFSRDAKRALDPLDTTISPNQSLTANILESYIFPFQSGTLVKFFRFHFNTTENFTFWTGANSKAVDLGSDGNTGVNHTPNQLLAVASGWVRQRCSQEGSYSSTYIAVENDDGAKIIYAHLNKSDAPASGTRIVQGQYIGTLKTGNFSDSVCGHASQGASEFHVHFEVPNTSSLTLSDWTLNTSTGTWTRGNETWTSGQYKQVGGSGSSCPGPSLNSPSEGHVSSSQTISFSWSALSGCTFNGYTFRVNDSSNMEDSPIIDQGEGGTTRTETIGSQWNNRDLWWGVRAANAPNGASWSTRRFRIEPQTNCPQDGGVILYWNANYNCSNDLGDSGYRQRTSTGLQNVIDGQFNDRASSIKIPSGWSVRLFNDANGFGGSGSICYNTSISDFGTQGNFPGTGTPINDKVSSIEVFDNTTCSNGSPPAEPSPNSPANGQSFNEGEAITLSWSATGTEYFGEISGGPAGTFTFGWQTGASKNIGPQWAGYVYTWKVKARNNFGESSWSFAPAFFVRPGVPGSLSASAVSCNQINLAWVDNSGNEEGYKVYRNGNLVATLGSGATNYQNTGLAANTTYSYIVRAYRGNIESNDSNTASATTTACSAGVPSLLTPANGQVFNEGDPINVSWTATGSEYYGEIWGGPAGTLTFGWQAGTSKNIGPQWAGYVYSWHVKARNPSSESNWSSTSTFTVRPGTPLNLSASVISCNQINLAWADNSGNEEGYRIYRNGNLLVTVGSGVTGYQNTGLAGNTNYSYVVKAYRGSIESGASNTANATTGTCPVAPAPPSAFSASKGAYTDKVLLTWNASTGASRYEIWRSTQNTSGSASWIAENLTVLSYNDTADIPGATYYYWVKACNNAGCSNFSNSDFGYRPRNSASFNLLRNSGFEEGNTSPGWWNQGAWVPSNSSFVWVTDQKYSGARSIGIGNNSNNDAWWAQSVAVQPNKTYLLSGWIKTQIIAHSPEPNDVGANLSVLGDFEHTRPLIGSNDWTYVSLLFNSGTRTQVDIAARLGMYSGTTTGIAWFDDLKLEFVSAPTCYTLAKGINPAGSGAMTADPVPNCNNGTQYIHGTVVKLTVSPSASYSFSSWSGALSGASNPAYVTMTSAKSVTANFTLNSPCYSLVRTHTGNGADPLASPTNSNGCSNGNYHAGELITLTASPASGYQVGSWSATNNDASTSITNTLTMPAQTWGMAVNYVQIKYSLSVGKSGNGTGFVTSTPVGINCGADCSESYPVNTTVTLTASPNPSSAFAGWTGGGCSGTDTCTVTMTASKSVVANFADACFAINTYLNPGSGGFIYINQITDGDINPPPTCQYDNEYPEGAIIRLTADPEPGYEFSHWSGDVSDVSNPIDIAMYSDHNVVGNFNSTTANTDVYIGGIVQGSYDIPPQGSIRQSYLYVNDGPVKISGRNNLRTMGAERVIYKINGVNTSFTEMMGLPNSQLDTTYWLPWYNNADLDTQLRIANVSGSQATVTITIGTQTMPSFNLAAGASTRVSYPVNNGPVKIVSTQNIVAAERVIYKVNNVFTSFSEMMALPQKQLDSVYYLPWYNNSEFDTQLRIANVTNQPATVTVTIGTQTMPSFNLAAGASTRVSYPVNNGPVKIASTQNIVAAERVIYRVNGVPTSFSEMMALPNSKLHTTHWLPWYNNVGLSTQLRISNVSNTTATIRVYIGGKEMLGSPFNLAPGTGVSKSYAGIDNGPVRIVSTQNIVVSEPLIYKVNGTNVSFSEMMGLPDPLLDAIYWLPWYNNINLDTQLRFGRP